MAYTTTTDPARAAIDLYGSMAWRKASLADMRRENASRGPEYVASEIEMLEGCATETGEVTQRMDAMAQQLANAHTLRARQAREAYEAFMFIFDNPELFDAYAKMYERMEALHKNTIEKIWETLNEAAGKKRARIEQEASRAPASLKEQISALENRLSALEEQA